MPEPDFGTRRERTNDLHVRTGPLPNACIAERHRPAWQRGADEARLLLREKRLPEPQRVTLQAEVARIQRVLEQIAPSTATPHNGMAGEEEEAGLQVTD